MIFDFNFPSSYLQAIDSTSQGTLGIKFYLYFQNDVQNFLRSLQDKFILLS